ncbi:MAG: Lrp/AsnC family transcriptional regulator [Candidatus Bathyarchaeota archaeon]|jgi:DNA-binding Lrp family transcriptional regulator
MGVVAYTFIRTSHRRIQELVNKIKKIQFVKEITPVYGEYDIIVKTETKSIKELTMLIYSKLRPIPGLEMTTTMITAKPRKKS